MKKWFIICFFTFVIFPLFFLFFVIDLPARKIINEEMKNIKEKKEPLNLSEIILEKRNPKPELNEEIKNFIKETEKIDLKIFSRFFTSDGYDKNVYNEIKNQKIIEKQEHLINCCKYIIDNFCLTTDEKSIKQYVSLFSPLYRISEIVRVRCVINAIENNKNKVFDDIFLMSKIAKFTNQPVNLFTLSWSCSIYQNIAKCIKDILNILIIDKNFIEIIEKNLPEFDSQTYKFTLFRERAIYNEYFKDLMKGKKGFWESPFKFYDIPFEDSSRKFVRFPLNIYFKPIIRSTKGTYLYFFRKLLDIENIPLKDRKKYLREIEKEVGSLPGYFGILLYTSEFQLSFTFYYNNFLTTKTYENLLFTNISIEKYRKEKGVTPKKIEGIGFSQSKMLDPFTDRMLNYKKEKEGYKLWSVGVNGIDEGGVYLNYEEKRKMGYKRDEKDDIVWIMKK